MRKRLLAAAATVGLALGTTVAPAIADVPITLNLGATYWSFDGDRERPGGNKLENDYTPWGSIEWAFNDNWAAEVFYADGDTEYKYGPDTDMLTWQVGMLYYGGSYIGKPMRIRPYAGFGAGEIYIDADAWDTKETILNAAFGLRWMLGTRLGMRLEWRPMFSLDEDRWDSLLSVGLNLYTGKVKADPPPVIVPLDSDGDGVNDDIDQCPGTPAGVRVDSMGCPMAVTQIASIKLMVNFGFDSTKVEEKYFNDLAELAGFLKRFEDVQVDVEGHTDNVGPDTYNQELSQSRAQAVVDMLVDEYGIARDRLEAIGYGESKPVADNDTADGRAENRRVMATLEVEYSE